MTGHLYYTLGRTGLKISRLAFGAMTFGTDWGWGADKQTSQALFDHYLDAGGNFVDTAEGYTGGVSEQWLGEFVKARNARDRVVISTKYSFGTEPGNPNSAGNGRKNMLRAVDGSLRRLGSDYIDLYLLHAWDQVTPPEEVLRTFDDLVRVGKIRHFGLSNVPSWYASRVQTVAELRGLEPVSTLQMEYSLVERRVEFEYTRLATDYGMGFMAWSPLGGGLLSGKYKPSTEGPFGEGRLEAMRNSPNQAFRKFTDRNFAIVAQLEKVSSEIGRPMAQVALNWVANRPGVATVILGATKLEQLEDNLRALDFEIPAALAARLDEVSSPKAPYPYTFFDPGLQAMVHGGAGVGDKPAAYRTHLLVPPGPASPPSAKK
jgi:aryl-alcohol dehydrogenase-like predicted oxidoreductase